MGARNEVLSVSNLPVLTNVQPDIRLEGKIHVITDATVKGLMDQGQYNSDGQDQFAGEGSDL
jgi:hypothetical protein